MTIHLFLPRHQHPCGHAGQIAGPSPEHKGDIFFKQSAGKSSWIIEVLFNCCICLNKSLQHLGIRICMRECGSRVLRIRIRMRLGLPDPLERGTDPDPFIIKLKLYEKP
jgi:hypothetical protein